MSISFANIHIGILLQLQCQYARANTKSRRENWGIGHITVQSEPKNVIADPTPEPTFVNLSLPEKLRTREKKEKSFCINYDPGVTHKTPRIDAAFLLQKLFL